MHIILGNVYARSICSFDAIEPKVRNMGDFFPLWLSSVYCHAEINDPMVAKDLS